MDLTERTQLTRWLAVQLVVTLLQSLVLALLVQWLLLGFGRTVGVVGPWAVALVAMTALRLQRLALPGTGARRRRRRAAHARGALGEPGSTAVGRAALEPMAPLPETLDRRFRRLARHADRLTYAVVATRHYDNGVRPVLADLATDRLRRHHGIDTTAEPERAREVMGEDLWQALMLDRPQPPTTADLDRWLTTLEQLGEGSSAPSGRPRPA